MSEPTPPAGDTRPLPAVPLAGGDAAAPAGAPLAASPRERVAAGIWIGVFAVAVLAFFYLLAPILTPFALGAVLAYLLLPGTHWLQRHRVPRVLAAALMVLLTAAAALGLLLILIPVLQREGQALNERLPALIGLLNDRVAPLLLKWLGVHMHFDSAILRSLAVQHVGQEDLVNKLLEKFSSGGLAVIGLIGTMVLVPVVLFYLLLDWASFASRLEASIPRRWHARTVGFLGDIDAVLSQFLRGQLTVMLLLALYYSVALSIAGLDSALPIGVLTGLLIFIPYVGFVLGFLLAVVVALLQFTSWQELLVIVGIYGTGNVIEGFLLTPRLVGERIGLHPLAVIFALLAFGHVFGFLGVLVALPTSAVLLIALRHLRQQYLASAFYNRP